MTSLTQFVDISSSQHKEININKKSASQEPYVTAVSSEINYANTLHTSTEHIKSDLIDPDYVLQQKSSHSYATTSSGEEDVQGKRINPPHIQHTHGQPEYSVQGTSPDTYTSTSYISEPTDKMAGQPAYVGQTVNPQSYTSTTTVPEPSDKMAGRPGYSVQGSSPESYTNTSYKTTPKKYKSRGQPYTTSSNGANYTN
mmetsp:Transcript_9691/g.10732  ORF Transcript_9691/g.10732 Transcript_9691/m.10732 type:complete len:198 (-) Transcript_9691:78-671(-)|eukprot:CAMPEP_0168511632 /NCGR_PEP_ID=MMETSP0405-20121227/2255_1 /TAXON_ID=498012 /ORGANISM="Trichosphaerium sp, Strain Am-I-7 wt" /LENGTH=197 /DNA_ID=CAMNT_0008529855 /DNA_START=127 /DNA_END=720 /DNA_ORIENTATION=-